MEGFLGWIDTHQGLAGWAQAIASVAAIYWAGRFASRELASQESLQRETERQERIRRVQSFIALAEVGLQELGNALSSTKASESSFIDYATYVYAPRSFVGLENALAAFPIHELPDPTCVAAAQRFRDGFSHGHKAVEMWTDAVIHNKPEEERHRVYIDDAHEYSNSQLAVLRRCLSDY